MRSQIWKHASRGVIVRLACMALMMATASLLYGQQIPATQTYKPSASAQPVERDFRFEVASIRPVGPPTGHEYPSGVIPPAYTRGVSGKKRYISGLWPGWPSE